VEEQKESVMDKVKKQ